MGRTTILLTGLFVLAAACQPPEPPPGNGEGKELGIIIQSISTSPARDSTCVNVDLTYKVQLIHKEARINIEYKWNVDAATVTGLAPHTETVAGEETTVNRAFTFCPKRPSQPVYILPFQIIVSGSKTLFRAFPRVSHIPGSERWDASLIPSIRDLKRRMGETTSPTPSLLRRFWRATAAYYAGGYDAFDRQIEARIARETDSMRTKPPTSVLDAYRSLLVQNGGKAVVAFSRSKTLVRSIELNESFQVKSPLKENILGLITKGVVRRLLQLTPQDELYIQDFDESSKGVVITFKRRVRGLLTFPDTITASVVASGNGYSLKNVTANWGNAKGADCKGASPEIFAKYDLTDSPGFHSVVSFNALLRDHGVYRCVYRWEALYNDPDQGFVPYDRTVDARTGKMITDGIKEAETGTDNTSHFLGTSISLPYKYSYVPGVSGEFNNSAARMSYGGCMVYPPPNHDSRTFFEIDNFDGSFMPAVALRARWRLSLHRRWHRFPA